jgi:hypothetical protein
MIKPMHVMMVLLLLCSLSLAENKGYCPAAPANIAPSQKASPPTSTDPDKKYFGTVTLLAVISDRGYVCSTHILHGLSKELDKKTEAAVKGCHFDPARKDGRALPVFVSLNVNYWTTRTGEIVSDPSPPQCPASSDKPAP